MVDLLGRRGIDYVEMTTLGIPIPPGFVISSTYCAEYEKLGGKWPLGLEEELKDNMAKAEAAMDAKLGDPSRPLLVSVQASPATTLGIRSLGL